jgi:two-component SAPR family response regulator
MNSIDINIPYVSEKDIDFLIIEEFLSNENFQEIFLKKINFGKINILSINHSLTTIDGESDIVIISRHKELNVGLFIEDKIDAIAMPFQHQRYIERAKKMVEENIIDDYKLFIVAPFIYF